MNGQKRTEAALATATGMSEEKSMVLAASVTSVERYPRHVPPTSMMASNQWTWCIYGDNLPPDQQKQVSRMATEAQRKSRGITYVDLATQAAKDMKKTRVTKITPAGYYWTNERKVGDIDGNNISKEANVKGLRVVDRLVGRPDKRKDHPMRTAIKEQQDRYRHDNLRPANEETLFALHKETIIRMIGEENVDDAVDFRELANWKEKKMDEDKQVRNQLEEKRYLKIGTYKRKM